MPLLVGNLGDYWYGIWTIIASFTGIYYVFNFGLTDAISRYIAKYNSQQESEKCNYVISTSFAIFLLYALILVCFTFVLMHFSSYFIEENNNQETIKYLILITGLSIAIELPFHAFAGIPEAHMRFDLLALNRIFFLVLVSVLHYFVITNGGNLIDIVNISFCVNRINNILFYCLGKYLFRNLRVDLKYIRIEYIRKLVSYSVWSFLISIFKEIDLKTYPLIISYIISPVAVTHYFIGDRLVDYTNRFINQATNILKPIFTEYHANNRYYDIRKMLLFMIRINIIIAFYVYGGLFIFSESFISNWMGDEYLDAYNIIKVRSIGMLYVFCINPCANVLYAINKHKVLAKITVVQAVIYLILCTSLTMQFGIIGVAYAITIPSVIFYTIVGYKTFILTGQNVLDALGKIYNLVIINIVFLAIFIYVFRLLTSVKMSYSEIFLFSIIYTLCYSTIVFFGLSKNELHLIYKSLPFVKTVK